MSEVPVLFQTKVERKKTIPLLKVILVINQEEMIRLWAKVAIF